MIFENINLITWAILFFVYLIYDILYAKYILYVSKLNAFKAANTGVLLYMLVAYGTVQYVTNLWNIIPIVLGSWIGTYFTIRYENKRKQKRKLNIGKNK